MMMRRRSSVAIDAAMAMPAIAPGLTTDCGRGGTVGEMLLEAVD